MENRIKKGLLIFFIALMIIPCIQESLSLFANDHLAGTFLPSPDVEFSKENWLDGYYQERKANYLCDHVGFRPFMIRVNNQVDFSLFDKFHAQKIIKGKGDCFFTTSMIESYYGKDFIGKDRITQKIMMLKAIQDTLAKLGKSVILAYAAEKAFYYPEYIPEKYKNQLKGPTNYDAYASIATSLGVNQVDFNSWFLSMKSKAEEELYPKEGVHWSTYGALLAADSMIKYIERLRHIQMMHPVWDKILRTHEARYYDDDISKGLNLLFQATNEVYSYPDVTFKGKPGAIRPKIIYIGDSYFLPWVREHVMDYINLDWQLWYYFRDVWERYNEEDMPKKQVNEYDCFKKIDEADCVIIMYTAQNLSRLGDGFIEKAYSHYFSFSQKPLY